MSDHMDVQNVITRYCDAVTRRDWDTLADLFVSDASWQVIGGPALHFKGKDVVPGIKRIVESTGFLVQINTPALIDINGGKATARSTIYELGANKDKSARFEEPGIYEDVLKKLDGRWKFISRRCTILHFQADRIEDVTL